MFQTKWRSRAASLLCAVALAIFGTLGLAPASSGTEIPVTVTVDEAQDQEAPPAPADPVDEGTPSGLPMTGAELGAMIALALGLVATGTLLWFGSERTRRQS